MESTPEQKKQEQEEWMDRYDHEMADGIEVVWKRRDDLKAYVRFLSHLYGEVGTEEDRAEDSEVPGGDISHTVRYSDSTIEQLRKDLGFIEAELNRSELELANIDEALKIFDRAMGGVLGGTDRLSRDDLFLGLRDLWYE